MYLRLLKMDPSNSCYCSIETFHDKTTDSGLSFSDKYCI